MLRKLRFGILGTLVLAPASLFAQANVGVNAGKVVRTADARWFGINTAVWDGSFNDGNTAGLLRAANIGILRFPGGSLSDVYHWQTNVSDNVTQYNSTTKPDLDGGPNTWNWSTSFDTFESVVSSVNAQQMITVNYGSGTPAEAAAWVKYANVTKGLGIKYWEIGNELYGTWEADTNGPTAQNPGYLPHDPWTYATRAAQYITAMKAVDPSIKIGVVAVPGEDADMNNTAHPATNPVTNTVHNGWTPVMLATFKSLGVMPDFLIYHRYEEYENWSDATLLQDAGSAAGGWQYVATDLRTQLKSYLGQQAAAGIELLDTENNSDTSPDLSKQSTSLVNGLYYADSLGYLAQTEFNSLIWWDLRNGQDTKGDLSASLYGWRMYGDLGVINPNNDADQYPPYKVMKLVTHFAGAGDSIVQATSDTTLLSAFAARRADGSLSIMVVNKSPTAANNANFTVSGFTPGATTATEYAYGMTQDNAAQAGSTGADTDPSTTTGVPIGSGTFSLSLPPYSVSILSIPGLVPPAFTLQPAGSVTVASGSPAAFSVAASGSPAPTYQWYLGSTAISGATDPVLFLPSVAAANAGSYTCVATNSAGSATSQAAVLSVGTGGPGYLINLSARGYVGSGSVNNLIVGFYTTGVTKSYLLRGVGPTLGNYGLANALGAPLLNLFQVNPDGSSTIISTNAAWGGTAALQQAFQATGAFSLPSNSADTALLANLGAAGGGTAGYSSQVSIQSGQPGVALAEIYDDATNAAPGARLINVSSRGLVQTGSGILVDGFVVTGSNAETVLIRAVGPTLTNFGVPGALAQPQIAVFVSGGNTPFATNAGWAGDPALSTAANQVSAFGLKHNADAALLLTLPPGQYTAQVSGVNGTTGIALAEVYEVR